MGEGEEEAKDGVLSVPFFTEDESSCFTHSAVRSGFQTSVVCLEFASSFSIFCFLVGGQEPGVSGTEGVRGGGEEGSKDGGGTKEGESLFNIVLYEGIELLSLWFTIVKPLHEACPVGSRGGRSKIGITDGACFITRFGRAAIALF